jgi:hypothetical protein
MPVDNEQLMDKLSSFHSEFTEFRGEMKARIANVEGDVKESQKWENIKLFMILPISAGLHTIAAKIGLIKG